MDRRIYWMWLTNLPNITPIKITNLFDSFNDIEEIYKTKDYAGVYGLTHEDIVQLQDKSLDKVKSIVDRLKYINAGVLTYDDMTYPDMLRQIDDPPYVLYIKGEIMQWDRLLTIAAVGTRRYNEYGHNVCNNICSGLAKAGVTIVSGMARGLDSVAAAAALRAGAKTIAVLGCGLDIVYPPENGQLMEAIIRNGAVLSEYPPGVQPVGSHFPRRNRIISGMSYGTLVTQAPQKSGALITANYALDSGKDVFAVPGNIYDVCSKGNNALIKSGAKLVECAQDILEEYDFEILHLKEPIDKKSEFENLKYAEEPAKEKKPKENKSAEKKENKKREPVNNIIKIDINDDKYKNLNETEKKIIELLIEDTWHIDEIVRKTGIPMSKLNSTLTILEMKSLIKQLPGKNFRLNIQNRL